MPCIFTFVSLKRTAAYSAMSQPNQPPTMASNNEVEKDYTCEGQGTVDAPFIVEFLKDDPYNPMNWSKTRKWTITFVVSVSVFLVTFTSAAYSVSSRQVMQEFDVSSEVFTLGLSLFVLGFAIGPTVWGPLVSATFSWPNCTLHLS